MTLHERCEQMQRQLSALKSWLEEATDETEQLDRDLQKLIDSLPEPKESASRRTALAKTPA